MDVRPSLPAYRLIFPIASRYLGIPTRSPPKSSVTHVTFSALSAPTGECTQDGLSGGVIVPEIGCAAHTDDGNFFCYVADPSKCKDFSLESTSYPGARSATDPELSITLF